ncbi:hypothetical protein [Chitinibacter sp. GC72]|uniref:hypothetical protein n=1 Tax=Chitinibacter sp. GC72 TaxID=1526917 RepID=UPI0012F7C1EF|nr:hypothetical protein [Chitinibacter sp. GC72]
MSSTISNLNVNVSSSNTVTLRSSQTSSATKESPVEQEKVELNGEPAQALTYDKPGSANSKNPRIVPPDLETLLAQSQKQAESLINLVRNLVEEQGLDFTLVVSGEQKLNADQSTIDAAKAAIGEDGEFGVKKVAERILSFAKFAIGDDPANLEKIRAAVQEGFDSAKEVLGGTLPEISQKTYEAIMGEFDRWEKEGLPTGDTVGLSTTA